MSKPAAQPPPPQRHPGAIAECDPDGSHIVEGAQTHKERIEQGEVRHLGVFALAPQPLLIELVCLLGDIVSTTVHQRHRERSTWRWQAGQPAIAFEIADPGN